MQVPDVPSYEEFFGLIDNELDDEEFDPDEKDEKIRKIIAIALSLLQEFYLLHKYDNEYYISSEVFQEELKEFNEFLKENLITLFNKYFEEVVDELNVKYDLPAGVVLPSVDIESVINSGVDSVTDTLYADLKNKADFYKDVAITTGTFSLHANFRRAIKKLTGVITNNAMYSAHIIDRDFLSFVYGQEALFQWRVTGINTCAWCYEMEAIGAMPLSWFPVDHPNGRCWLEPVNPDEYSDKYKDIKGW